MKLSENAVWIIFFLIFMLPLVGVVIPAIILNSVVFPLPLGPMMPTRSPFLMVRLMSLSAQNSSSFPFANRSTSVGFSWWIVYFFVTPLSLMAIWSRLFGFCIKFHSQIDANHSRMKLELLMIRLYSSLGRRKFTKIVYGFLSYRSAAIS